MVARFVRRRFLPDRVVFFLLLLSSSLIVAQSSAPAAPPDPSVLLSDGEAALSAGDLIGAMRAFRAVLDLEPASWRGRDGMGRTFRASGDLESAERELRRAVELAPFEAPPGVHLADLYLAAPELESRRQGFRWLGESAHGSVEVQMLVARESRRAGDYSTAAAALDRARKLAPDGKAAMVEQILLHIDTLQYDRAEELALAFADRFPSYPQTHVQLARIYRLQGRLDEAEAQYRRALELAPDEAIALTRLAEVRLARKDLVEARELLSRAIAVAPERYQAHYLLGRLFLLQGDSAAAEAEMRKFRELKDAMRAHTRLAGGASMVDE